MQSQQDSSAFETPISNDTPCTLSAFTTAPCDTLPVQLPKPSRSGILNGCPLSAAFEMVNLGMFGVVGSEHMATDIVRVLDWGRLNTGGSGKLEALNVVTELRERDDWALASQDATRQMRV